MATTLENAINNQGNEMKKRNIPAIPKKLKTLALGNSSGKTFKISKKPAFKNSTVSVRTAATPQQPSSDSRERAKLLRCCETLANHKNILAEFDKAVHLQGLVGEHRNSKLIYLAVISRTFERPISIVVKGSSSGGKNTLVSSVLKFVPPSAYCELTGMSDKALAYFDQPLKNRVLFVSEAAGLSGGEGAYFLRSLLSEGHVKWMVTVGKSTRLVEIEGPTGLIITTTKIKLYHDDETRLLSVNIADSRNQTRNILKEIGAEAAAADQTPRPALSPDWHALIEWVRLGPQRVTIPFAPSISELMSYAQQRLARDLKAVIGLVRAHALLHQKSRAITADGVVIATIADYRAVHLLVDSILAQGVDAAVSKPVRRTVEAVAKLLKTKARVSPKDLIEALDLDKANVSRHTQTAIDAGYLINPLAGKERTAHYVLNRPMPTDNSVLPSPEDVVTHHQTQKTKLKAKAS